MQLDKLYNELEFEPLDAYIFQYFNYNMHPINVFLKYVLDQYHQNTEEPFYNLPIDYFYQYLKHLFKYDRQTKFYNILYSNLNFNYELNTFILKFKRQFAKLAIKDKDFKFPIHIEAKIRKHFLR